MHQMRVVAAVTNFCTKHGESFYGTVAPGEVLYTQFGYVISECLSEERKVSGLRVPVVLKDSKTEIEHVRTALPKGRRPTEGG